MVYKFIIYLSFLAFVVADDFIVDENTQKVVEACQDENNVTEEEIHKFVQQEIPVTEQVKDFFLCVTQKLGTFDGVNWNRDAIKNVVADEEKMKEVDECLSKDDTSLEPRERNFVVVMCCVEKEAFL